MNVRPGRGIFDPAITAAPCKFPCNDWRHVHDEDLPSNFSTRGDWDPERLSPWLRSDPTEVFD